MTETNPHDRHAVFSNNPPCQHTAIGSKAYQQSQQALNEQYRLMVGRLEDDYDPRIHNTVICRPSGAGPSRLTAIERIRLQPFF